MEKDKDIYVPRYDEVIYKILVREIFGEKEGSDG
jgi:hypothetical protein